MMGINNVNNTGMMNNNSHGTTDYSRNPKFNNNAPLDFGQVPATFQPSAFSAPRLSAGETLNNGSNENFLLTGKDLETANQLIAKNFFDPNDPNGKQSLSLGKWLELTAKGHSGSPISPAEQQQALSSLSDKQKKIMESLYSEQVNRARDFADNGRRDHSV
jgi:hypothetical protein